MLIITRQQVEFNHLSILDLVAVNLEIVRPVEAVKAALWVLDNTVLQFFRLF